MEQQQFERTQDDAQPRTSKSNLLTEIKEDSSKVELKQSSIVHIPYILNGELYQIQTQEGENVTVKCCHCPPDRVYRGSVRSTGNFHMHIKRRHPDLLGKLHEMKVNALLERRDRLMKNRKTHRCGRGQAAVKRETHTETPKTPQLSLMHTHKLKIKTAFQRHQLQQQEALRNWNVTPFVVVPIAKSPEMTQPIDYSVKECNNNVQQLQFDDDNVPAVPAQSEQIKILNAALADSYEHEEEQHTMQQQQGDEQLLQGEPHINYEQHNIEHQQEIASNAQCLYECGTVPATPSPSSISSYGSNLSVDNYYNRLAVVKNEHLMPEQAIDLSLQNSGLSSSGIESAATLSCDTTLNNVDNVPTSYAPISPKWDDLLLQVETSLRDIQSELHTRNQIETNRLILDVAKFKYLHPSFNFQC